MSGPGDLKRQAEEFGQEMAGLLCATLPDMPESPVVILQRDDRFVIRAAETGSVRGLPLKIDGRSLACLALSFACKLDSVGQYLAVEESTINLLAILDRTPVLRIHYYRAPRGKPGAHLHLHGHRGALSHLLSQAGHDHPHDISSLHIPVGGNRFRPCLEDFIQFLIVECHFDALQGWQDHVEAGRERWRRRQTAAVVRDVPDEAARVLGDLGYTVEAPDPPPAASRKALRNW